MQLAVVDIAPVFQCKRHHCVYQIQPPPRDHDSDESYLVSSIRCHLLFLYQLVYYCYYYFYLYFLYTV